MYLLSVNLSCFATVLYNAPYLCISLTLAILSFNLFLSHLVFHSFMFSVRSAQMFYLMWGLFDRFYGNLNRWQWEDLVFDETVLVSLNGCSTRNNIWSTTTTNMYLYTIEHIT